MHAIPRHYMSCSTALAKQVELHTFTDASQVAYGVASYLRIVDGGGRTSVVFVYGKARLAPLKQQSIPRLELCTATLAAKATARVRHEIILKCSRLILWTDSTLVFQYIINPSRRLKTYVANRVASIHRVFMPEQWRHINSEVNPADDVSRGVTPRELMMKARWHMGHGFLQHPEECWPKNLETPQELPENTKVSRQCTVTISD